MVASVTQLRSSATAVSYYEKDGYYAKDDPEHRDASFWQGKAATESGLRGHVLPGEFEDLLEGWVPGTEIRLGRLREGEHDHRPGWDITFSAPKSVSLEGLVMGDRRVIRAHDDAVRATLKWIETDLLQTRGWDPITRQRPRVAADGMIVAGFRHLASRSGDPQLHTHCVLANMTRNASGEWRSVEPTAIRRSEKLIGAYYRNELARRLQSLGMAVTPTLIGRVPGFELAGYDKTFLDAFSGRRAEILAYLEEHGLANTARNTQLAALATRRAKQEVGLSELVPRWRARVEEMGLVRDRGALRPDRPVDPATGERVAPVEVAPPDLPANELRSLRRAPKLPRLPGRPREGWVPSRGPAEALPVPETGVLEAVARAVSHVSERRTWVAEAEIRAVALGHAPGRYALAEIDGAIGRLVAGGELIEVERRGMDRAFVTEAAVRAERKILDLMRDGQGAGKRLCDAGAVEERLAGSRLTPGQREAVRTVLLSEDVVVGVQGHAGSGKTTMLCEVKELLGARPIQGLAPSAAAARVLGSEAGIPSTTLQWFLTRYGDIPDAEQLALARAAYSGKVLAVDECSMIDTGRMEQLLRIARRLDVARVALVGDTAQLRAVDAGQPFRLLQKAGMKTATMDQVLRQRDEELREAVLRARYGAPGESIRSLREGRVREVPREALGDEAARCWLALAPEERADTAVMAPTHEIRRRTNEAIREGLSEEGTLRGRVLEVDRLVNRHLTRAQASELSSYEPGDRTVFHADAYGCRTDDVCTVTGKRDGRVILAHADGGERSFRPSGNAKNYLGLFDTERIELRAGDRIRWTRNRKAPPPRFGHPPQPSLVNGGEAKILEIGRKRVRFEDGEREFSLALGDPQLRHLDHAYCTTVHAAQGKTAKGAIAVLDAGGAADQEMFHVEISRVKDEFLLLTDDREALIELLEGRSGGEEGALEAIGLDPGTGGTGPAALPWEDPEIHLALERDWRGLERRAAEANTTPFFLAGYREVMARAATLAAVGGLPGELDRLVGRMLAEHRKHLARDREVQDLVGRIQEHWRCWPELGWGGGEEGAEEVPERAAWSADGTALAEEGLRLAAVPGPAAGGLAEALADLDRTRELDDARRFVRLWRARRERAARDGVPELLMEGDAEVSALGERLAGAEGLDARARRALAEWREVRAGQAAMAEAVRVLPGRVAAWRGRQAGREVDEHGAVDPDDPTGPARRAWRAEGEELAALAGAMLDPGDPHAPYLDAEPGARERIERSAEAVREALDREGWERFASLARTVNRQRDETGTETFHLPGYGEMLDEARTLAEQAELSKGHRESVGRLLRYHQEATRLCGEIRGWPGRAEALLKERPAPEAAPGALTEWRKRAEELLGEAHAMRAKDSPHAPHLRAMPAEREALDGAVAEVEYAEAERLAQAARAFAERTGGIEYDAPTHRALMERLRALDARGGLAEDRREVVDALLRQDERLGKDRQRVGVFLDAAAQVEDGRRPAAAGDVKEAKAIREDIPRPQLVAHLAALGAAADSIEETERKIRERIARDEEARRAAERALVDEMFGTSQERARAAAEEEREERASATRRDRAAPPGREEPPRPTRAERQAARLADRLDACMARRDRVLERARDELGDYRPVADLGMAHARLGRQTGRALKAGRELLGNDRYAPFLDGLGGRARIQAAVRRLESAAVLDRLPARIAAGWEQLDKRVRESGGHRFFLPEHGDLCREMDNLSTFVRDKAASRFIGDERDMRKRMTVEAEWLGDVADRLRNCAGERGGSFVRQEDYPVWRHGTERAVREAEEILSDGRKYAPHFAHDPKLRDTLRTVSASLDRSLREDGAEWERVQSERAEARARQRQQDRSRDRGFSM